MAIFSGEVTIKVKFKDIQVAVGFKFTLLATYWQQILQ